ncbi:hypothetical protein GCM10011519_25560 [Marmoricola endophyticus]|uniref:Leucine rich repeat variant n=1 Tax=Marmoricola endophyticus TaxID=2040280 RepID=A0A917BL80_9ACTN|nr:hypothetical protein [Marmoricola endophyticus]GGF50486.1 hypothetical protein GCM10011519_25560 [Marmoricola endophyticus]
MSCLGFLTAAQREALAASSAAGAPLSTFASPAASPGKTRRVRSLAGSADARIRESAALSAHAPHDVLTVLAGDPISSVRACVARNAGAGPLLLRRLSGDPEAVVRAWVAANPQVTDDVLQLLIGDADPSVRAVVEWAGRWPAQEGGTR